VWLRSRRLANLTGGYDAEPAQPVKFEVRSRQAVLTLT
jgi:hypothetical protein